MKESCIYCPKCEKSIPKDEVAERSKQLMALAGDDSLERGICPVCKTRMIDLDKVKKGR